MCGEQMVMLVCMNVYLYKYNFVFKSNDVNKQGGFTKAI